MCSIVKNIDDNRKLIIRKKNYDYKCSRKMANTLILIYL